MEMIMGDVEMVLDVPQHYCGVLRVFVFERQ